MELIDFRYPRKRQVDGKYDCLSIYTANLIGIMLADKKKRFNKFVILESDDKEVDIGIKEMWLEVHDDQLEFEKAFIPHATKPTDETIKVFHQPAIMICKPMDREGNIRENLCYKPLFLRNVMSNE